GTIDLWALDGTGQAVAYLLNGTTLTAQTAQTLTGPTHTWQLDGTADRAAVGTAKDTSGNLDLTASGNLSAANGGGPAVTGHAGDLFSPDVLINTATPAGSTQLTPDGNATGTLAAGSNAVDTTKSFTVDLWAKPTNYGGVVVSQDANRASGFIVYAENDWRFGMTRGDNDSWDYDLVTGPPVTFGVWAHVTVAFNAGNSTMYLYVDGRLAGTATHTARVGSTGPLRISGYKYQGVQTARYNGQIADVRTYSRSLNGTQAQLTRTADGTWGNAETVAFVPDTTQAGAALLPNGDTVYVTLAGGKEYAQWHYRNGTWSTRTLIPTKGTDNVDVTGITAIAVTADSSGAVQVLSIANGGLRHQTWKPATGWSKDDVPPTSGTGVTAIAATGGYSDGSSQFMSVIGGVIYHQSRFSDGTWSTFTQLGYSGVTAVSAAALPDGSTQFVDVIGGVMYHLTRNLNGTWTGNNQLGGTGVTAVSAIGMANGGSQFAYVSNNNAYWLMRNANGTWSDTRQLATGASGVALTGYPLAPSGDPSYNTSTTIVTS
ncbi:concanavalin A-like lectin/glucanase superfamily protein, partial [Kitasatospora sp. SolWspMP-SS2h]|uniref:LamG domain-containing protein n=1 Tax=Kitasatospora sp. SolWspMP-SS2h TaxID=1305729 RepID=UPI000DC01FAB